MNKLSLYTKLRANILKKIRNFFEVRNILEVETPLLMSTTNPASYLDSFCFDNKFYLQTSPEFAMKRLLAICHKDIYQICKAFRKNEIGKIHNHEFTILEWYRINFDHHDLMNEMDNFFIDIANLSKAVRYTYHDIYMKYLDIDPYNTKIMDLKIIAKKYNLDISFVEEDIDIWLQILFSHLIEPHLIHYESPVFIYDFPESQAMLSKVRFEKQKIASRFEIYYRGIELANGFHELNDSNEQRQRFNNDLNMRNKLNMPLVPIDEALLSALNDLPNCSGVALGIDRLMLALSQKDHISIEDILLCRY